METSSSKLSKKPAAVIVLILILGLCIAQVVMTVLGQRSPLPTAKEALTYVGYLLVLAYALVGYRVSHGNLLKYTLLFFAALLVVTLMSNPSLYTGGAAPGQPQTETSAPAATEEYPPQPTGDPDAPERPNPLSPGQEKTLNLMELGFLGGAIILIAYMAGRLDRIRENQILCLLILALLVARAFLVNYESRAFPAGLNECTMWVVLATSYLFRYRQHKEAGQQDRIHT